MCTFKQEISNGSKQANKATEANTTTKATEANNATFAIEATEAVTSKATNAIQLTTYYATCKYHVPVELYGRVLCRYE
jgi:hypothetical protein